MVSKKSAATRRRVFTTLDSVDADTVAICALSAAAHSANTLRARKEQAVENAPAVLEAVRRAEESGEVLIRGLDWTAGPGVVRWAVEGWLEGKGEKVVRVGLKKAWGGGRGGGGVRGVARGRGGRGRGGGCGGGGGGEVWDASVLLSARSDAEKLLEASWNEGWIFLLGKKVTVERRGRLVPGIGGAWGSRREPWSKMFPVAVVECGEMKRDAGSGEDFFSSFWESGELLEAETVHVEINRALHVIAISLDQEQMMLVGTVSSGKTERKKLKMRIEIPFRSIIPEAQCHRISEESPHTSVYFRLAHPPELFREHPRHAEARAAQVTGRQDRLWDVEQGETPSIEWFRTGDPTKSLAFSRAQSIRVHLKKMKAWDFMAELQKTRLVDEMPNRSAIVPSKKPGAALDTTKLFVTARNEYNSPYSVRYEVECLISCGALLPSDLVGNDEFWSILGDLEEQVALRLLEMLYLFSRREHYYTLRDPVESLKEAMTHMPVKDTGRGHGHISARNGDGDREGTMSLGDGEGDAGYPIERFNRSQNVSDDDSDGSSSHIGEEDSSEGDTAADTVIQSKAEFNLTRIRRLVLSPTRVIVCRPEFDLLNRVLRHFHAHKERFIRVVFADEDRSSIFFNASDDVHARVRLLLDGVEVAGERFEFLAFSSSQLRFQAAWFFNEAPSRFDTTPPPTTDEIRAWMGDFSAIRVPAKFAARMGQAFSSTVGAVRLDHHQQGIIEDLFPRQRKYCFSDGCGLCSADIARFIARELGLRDGHVPSAFQVRFAGAKGMLVVWDDKVPREDGYEIMLRPSMIKFQSEHKAIEVVGYSKRLPLFLNYQLILLLVGLGIPDKVFVGMQRKILKGLDAVMKVSGAVPALNLLYASGFGSSDSRLCVLSPMLDVAAMFRAGLNCVNCEFLFNAMIAFRVQCLGELLKGRLPLGIDKGCSVIGVLDEAGVLEEDEVFLQCSDLQTGKIIGVEGPVVVGRSPCLHKGDVQPLKAYHTKYLPELGHLVDVLVFSQKGERPVPSMLSGGDLDGDQFAIIWLEKLVPTRPGHDPMDYTPATPMPLDRDVTIDDVKSFFVSYMQHDRLGQTATAHKVWSDKHWDGIFSDEASELAELHSRAVDAAKTGIFAEIPAGLRVRNDPNQYPDYMMRHDSISYPSKAVLGKMYRECQGSADSSFAVQKFDNAGPFSHQIDDIFFGIEGGAEFEVDAEVALADWNSQIIRLLDEFGIRTEGELVSGQVSSFETLHAQSRPRRDKKQVLMQLNRKMNILRGEFQSLFWDNLNCSPGEISQKAIEKACVWYRATARQAKRDREDGNEDTFPILSFPWCASEVLYKVVTAHLSHVG